MPASLTLLRAVGESGGRLFTGAPPHCPFKTAPDSKRQALASIPWVVRLSWLENAYLLRLFSPGDFGS